MSTFVSVGNAKQSFARLLDAVAACSDSLPQPVVIQHGHTPFDDIRFQAHAFLNMDQFVEQLQAAEVVIVHAGAGSVLHAIRAGKRPIVMPRRAKFGEHVDDHQLEFARELADIGCVVMVESKDTMAQALSGWNQVIAGAETREASGLLERISEILRDCDR